MVEVTVCRCRKFEGSEANVIKGLIVNTKGFVRILDELMNGEGSIVGLNRNALR